MGLLSGCQEKSKGTSQTLKKKTFHPRRPGPVSIVLNPLLVLTPTKYLRTSLLEAPFE